MVTVPNKVVVPGANDWGAAATWAPTGVPGAGDEVLLSDSTTDMTERVDVQDAIVLDYLGVVPSFIAALGATGKRLEIDAAVLRFAGGGTEAFVTGEFGTVILDPQQYTENAIVLSTKGGGTTPITYAIGGRCTLGSGAFTNVWLMAIRETQLYIAGADITTLQVDGYDLIVTSGTVGTIYNNGGRVRVTGGVVTNYVGPAGELNWEGGVITNIEARKQSQVNATKIKTARTITDLKALGSPFVDLRTGGDFIGVTTLTKVGAPIVMQDS